MIKLDTDDVDFLQMVIAKGNPQQSSAALQRLEDLVKLDTLAGGHVHLDSKDDGNGVSEAEQARLDMIERHQSAWKTERLDVTMGAPESVSKPHSFAPGEARMMAYEEGDAVEDEAEKAHREMVERNQSAWKKKPWQPGQED